MLGNDVCIVKLGLGIPECNGTYEEFTQEVKSLESVFKSKLINLLTDS